MLKIISNLNLKEKEKYFFISTFVIITLSILTNSIVDTNGFLTNDSTHFLKLAKSFSLNNDLHVYSWTNSGEINFFSMWPLGYPLLISFISDLTFLDVFWSSKLLNILSVLVVFLMIYKQTPFGYSFIALLFLFGSFINIFSYTITENLFMVGLVSYAYTSHNLSTNSNKKNMLLAFLSFAIAFSSRYIGGYLLVFNFFLILKSIKKGSIGTRNLIILLIASGIYMIAYLYMNKYFTGSLTYPHAYLTYESATEIILHFIKKVLEELNLIMASVRFSASPLFSIISSFISGIFISLVWLYCSRAKVKDSSLNTLGNNFVNLSLFYLIVVFAWRLTIWFSPFSYRILFPASILMMIGFAYKILSRTNLNLDGIKAIYLTLVLIGFLSIGYNVVYKQVSFEGISYTENVKRINKKYNEIDGGGAVIFGERQVDYLRTDLIPLKPYYLPLFEKTESLKEINRRIAKFDLLYFNIPEICQKPYRTLSGDRGLNCISTEKKIHSFDNKILDYIKENKKLGLHRIRDIR